MKEGFFSENNYGVTSLIKLNNYSTVMVIFLTNSFVDFSEAFNDRAPLSSSLVIHEAVEFQSFYVCVCVPILFPKRHKSGLVFQNFRVYLTNDFI